MSKTEQEVKVMGKRKELEHSRMKVKKIAFIGLIKEKRNCGNGSEKHYCSSGCCYHKSVSDHSVLCKTIRNVNGRYHQYVQCGQSGNERYCVTGNFRPGTV